MRIASRARGRVMIVALDGRIDAAATGPLCDTLVAHVRAGWLRLVVAFGPRAELTRPGLRGLVVAAKLLQARRGRMRLCGASQGTEDFARAASFRHLLRFDPDLDTALARISGPG